MIYMCYGGSRIPNTRDYNPKKIFIVQKNGYNVSLFSITEYYRKLKATSYSENVIHDFGWKALII